ncbi:D-alanyl-D-alanine carboxypeptidase/D-alanyl-D-alanine-endopeptidase [Hydrogenophaga sp. 5NK40-0174]|uniref:D-alanyl-D-alanine carboxypeptidase/D-alanyl-D-alanine endopeptidase n=1 Tax=Hydrogenophaga sp. 5NK40-0174 TaxID=3127649 RepID=UPI003105341F
MFLRQRHFTRTRSRRRPSGCLLAAWLLSALMAGPARADSSPQALRDTPLPAPVSEALAAAGIPEQHFAAMVVPVDGLIGPRVQHRADELVNPASVMKLVTTYAAMDMLGPDFTWTTRFYVDGDIADGVLYGNLYIRGGGDPKLVLERIQETFWALHSKGVQVILGDMVLDHSAFDLPPHDPAAFDGEALRPYNAAPDGLLVNFKSVILKFEPDRRAGVARVTSEPPLAGLDIQETIPLAGGGCGDWRGGLAADYSKPEKIRFEGRYPRRCGKQLWAVAYQDPDTYSARALEGLWRASGGALTGHSRYGLTPPGLKLLHEAHSLPLKDIIADVNQWSNNVMAQQVFLTLGQVAPDQVQELRAADGPLTPMRKGRFEHSKEVLRNWWVRTLGLRYSTPVVENGSGLSRTERLTPGALAALLLKAAQHPHGQAFVDSLSVAGVKGTAARIARSPNNAAHGKAWLKTGTLDDVSGVAGYVQALDGQRYVIAAFVNDAQARQGRPALDALVEWTASLGATRP